MPKSFREQYEEISSQPIFEGPADTPTAKAILKLVRRQSSFLFHLRSKQFSPEEGVWSPGVALFAEPIERPSISGNNEALLERLIDKYRELHDEFMLIRLGASD